MDALLGLGTEQLTVSSSSVGLASIPNAARKAMIRVRTAQVYQENDGTAAATNAGMAIDSGSFIDLTDGLYNLSQFRWIRGGSVDATLDVNYFR
jgi:hypothetical protein